MVFQERKWARRIERAAVHASLASRASGRLVRREGRGEAGEAALRPEAAARQLAGDGGEGV
jgi:hypothetical protein